MSSLEQSSAALVSTRVYLGQVTAVTGHTVTIDPADGGGTITEVPWYGTQPLVGDLLPMLLADGALIAVSSGRPNTGWLTLTLAAKWAAYGAGYQSPQYRVRDGRVELRGLCKTAVARTADSTIATLATYAPAARRLCRAIASSAVDTGASSAANTGAASAGTAHTHPIPHTHASPVWAARIDIETSGVISHTASAIYSLAVNGYLSLEGITWEIG